MFSRSQAKARLVDLLVLACSAILVFGPVELLFRLQEKKSSHGFRISKNQKLVYELFYPWNYQTAKPPGLKRIAVVGDSTPNGWGVGGPLSAFPRHLEKRLNKGGKRYEVLNFSVPGYNTSQEAELIRTQVLSHHPDLVILFFCGNDVNLSNFFQPDVTPLNYVYQKSFLAHRLLRAIDARLSRAGVDTPEKRLIKRRWRWFKKKILGMFYSSQVMYIYPGLEQAPGENPPSDPARVPPKYHYMLGYSNYRIHLASIIEALREKGVPLISMGEFTPEAREINRSLGITVFEIADGLKKRNLKREEITVSKNDSHLGKKWHALVAEDLHRFLIEKYFQGD